MKVLLNALERDGKIERVPRKRGQFDDLRSEIWASEIFCGKADGIFIEC